MFLHVAHPRIKKVFFDFVQFDRTNSEIVCTRIMECLYHHVALICPK